MKKALSKLLVLSMVASLISYVPEGREAYAAYTPGPVADNFDSLASGSLASVAGADYTITSNAAQGPALNAYISGDQHVSGTNSLMMVDGSSAQWVKARKKFTSNPSAATKVIAEANIYAAAAGGWIEMNLTDSVGNAMIRTISTGTALKYGSSQTQVPSLTLPAKQTWYNLRLEANSSATPKTFDIYVNDALVVSQASFSNTAALDTIQFATGTSNTSTFYIDDIYAREAVGPTPGLTADTDNNTIQNPVDLTFAEDAASQQWMGSITGITVDGAALNPALYSITSGNVHIAQEVFPSAKTYKIIITADGYFNARVDQVIVGQPQKTSPTLTPDTDGNTIGNAVDITFTDDPAWRASVTGVTVDGTPVDSAKFTVTAGVLHIDGSVFTAAKDYAITVAAAGYAPATVTQPMVEPVLGVRPVTASLPSKQYNTGITVALSTPTNQAAIFYKVDDSSYTPYTGPLTITSTQQITAKAVKNSEESAESTFYYSIISDARPAITNSETFTGWTNKVLDTAHVKEGTNSAKWSDPSAPVYVNGITTDWNQYDQLEFWVYSGKATQNNISVIIDCDNNTATGYDYFIAPFKVDWVGWKKVAIPLSKFTKSTSRTTFAEYRRLIFHQRWYANDPAADPAMELYFDDMVLSKKQIDVSTDSIVQYAKPGIDLDYTFTVTNKSNAASAYQLTLDPSTTTFDSSYVVSFNSTTEQVLVGGDLQVDVHIKVPENASAGDVRSGTIKVRSTDGSEIAVKLQSSVAPWASTVGIHPNVMVTADQLVEAKAKVEKYQWAKDYKSAVVAKADVWLNTAMNFPDRPGGHSIWYYCGDTPLMYDYNEPHRHICPDDGKVYSGGDYDFAWRSTTHRKNIDAAKALAIAYALTDDPKYAQKTKEILTAYAKYYPSYPLQSRNGRLYWQSLDEAVQIIKLAHAYDLTAQSGLYSNDEQFAIEMNLFRQSAETLQKVDNGTSNFQTWHNAAIGTIGVLLGDDALIDVSVTGKSGFLYQMQNSVLSDGFWLEGAIGYHFYVQSALFMHAEALSHVSNANHPERDMFANANFKKMFEVTLDYVYPDLGVTNNNDSGGYPSSLVGDSTRVSPVDYEGVYAHYKTKDPQYASLPQYESLLNMIYGEHRQIRAGKFNPNDGNVDAYFGEQAVFYGLDEIPPAPPIEFKSKNFEGIGHAVLRSGVGADQTYALVDYGLHGESHGHFDKLHLDVFGKGTRLAPDFGVTSTYGESLYREYYKKTFSHNTVVVDGADQSIYKVNNAESFEPTMLFLDSDRFSITTNTANHVYNGVDLYDRTVAMTKDYIIDIFNVGSAGEHNYDWVLHGLGDFETEMALENVPPASIGTANGYQYLQGTKHAQQNGVWSGTWKNALGTGLRVIGLGDASDVIVGKLPGPATQDAYYDTVINRVHGNNASFVSILEPVSGSSGIAGVTRIDGSSFMVDLTSGKSNYIYHKTNAEAGKVSYLYAEGQNIDPAFAGQVNTSVDSGTLNIRYQPTSNVVAATAIVYAPNVTAVKFNSVDIPYTVNNGYVMVELPNDYTAPTTTAAASPINAEGWSNSDVSVTLQAADDHIGVYQTQYRFEDGEWQLYSAPVTVSSEGHHIMAYRSIDKAGNIEDAKTVLVDIDKTAPTVAYSESGNEYTVDQTVTITCQAADALSGIASTTCQDITGPAYTFGLGSHAYSATAADKAGNIGSATTEFTVRVTLESLISLLQQMFPQNKGTLQSMQAKLDNALDAEKDGKTNVRNNVLNAFLNEVSAQSGKGLTEEQANVLQNLVRELVQ